MLTLSKCGEAEAAVSVCVGLEPGIDIGFSERSQAWYKSQVHN